MGILKIIKKLSQDYARDIKDNIVDLFINNKVEGLTETQVYGIALTVAYALGNENLLNYIRTEAKLHLEEAQAEACKAAMVVMTMNNTLFHFTKDSTSAEHFTGVEHNLHMSWTKEHGIDGQDFEMYSLAISILNGCNYCINIHRGKLSARGITNQTVMTVAKIASVLRATAKVLEIESMRSYDFIARGPNM